MIRAAVLVLALALAAGPTAAQDRAQTLADIRQELSVLTVELQKLRRELATTGSGMEAPASPADGPIARLDGIESEVRRLTGKIEELKNRIDRIVADATNRIDDLKFRLTELEGGDVGQIPPTEPLGGEEAAAPAPVAPGDDGPEMAVGEGADFDAAVALMTEGTPADAYAAFNQFIETYPRSPLAAQAHLHRGEMLKALGNDAQAGRAFLESYTLAERSDPDLAARALLQLGTTLAALDQTREACISLGQVMDGFPDTEAASEAQAARSDLPCE
jgi:tol-pal system protein YbgF